MYKNPKKMAECFETQHDMERDMKNRVEKFEAENERLRDARVGNRGWRMRKAITVAMVAMLMLCGCGGNSIIRESDDGTVNVNCRFISDDGRDYFETVVDSETGVVYLVWGNGYRGGITPLLDKDGKVVISEEVDE